jgi:hypothetical protein
MQKPNFNAADSALPKQLPQSPQISQMFLRVSPTQNSGKPADSATSRARFINTPEIPILFHNPVKTL